MARGEGRKTRSSGVFGSVDKLPSGRYRAQYYGPDGIRHKAPTTFLTIEDTRGWLSIQQAAIISKTWKPPTARQPTKQTFKAYADNWLEHRKLADRTREDYRGWLDAHILPALGSLPLSAFDDREIIDNWYQKLNPDTPTLRARVYSLASTIFNSAVADRAKTGLTVNPCRIRGAASVSPRHRVRPADLAELEALTLAMPTRYRAMVLLAAWCALRFGELTELRRCDVDLVRGKVWIHRGVVKLKSKKKGVARRKVKKPKTEAGERPVTIPPHVVPILADHLKHHSEAGRYGLVFPRGERWALGTDHFSAPLGEGMQSSRTLAV